jgi:hypothetical protein
LEGIRILFKENANGEMNFMKSNKKARL